MTKTTLRVTNIAPILTDEGDLIVAGTPGTLLGWDGNEEKENRLVRVKWDAYMHVGEDDASNNTSSGLVWETEYTNLRFKG